MVEVEKGFCCICGLEKNLTYEHIPPQGSGNSLNVKSYKLNYINAKDEENLLKNLGKHTFVNLIEGKKYKPHQRGFGIHGTCESCNSTIKAVYDKDYINLTNWMLQLIKNETRLISEDSKSVKIKCPFEFVPIHFVKCVIAMFGVLYGKSLFEEHVGLRDFVMNSGSLAFDGKRYKLYMYLLKSQIIYKCEPAATGNVLTLEGKEQLLGIVNGKINPPLSLEFGAYPFGFVLDIDNTICRSELSDMSPWITSNKYMDLEFCLNAFEKDSPVPCQFK